MINFIICDDEVAITEIVKKIVSKTIFKTSIDYKIHIFNDYDEKFYNMVNSDLSNKIYILDIEVKDKSGIEVSKDIREKDWDSVILILTAHYELESLAFKSRILLFDFISKFDLYDKKIDESILACINKVLSKNKLTIKINRTINNIDFKDILYLEYDSYKRKTIIHTLTKNFEASESLTSIQKRLKGNFINTHRACIVNMDNVSKIDSKNKIIKFKQGKTTDLISRRYMKEVKQKCS